MSHAGSCGPGCAEGPGAAAGPARGSLAGVAWGECPTALLGPGELPHQGDPRARPAECSQGS